MIIVADTSPLNYLVQLEAVEVLPKLYGHIVIPREVMDELLQLDAPAVVQLWAQSAPRWLELRKPISIDLSLPIDLGEAAAISLAKELRADRLLMDDRDARDVAIRMGIPVAGTLAVLKDAALAG